MPRPDLAGILRVIAKVTGCQGPVLVAQQPIRRHLGGIEFHLDLHILGDRHGAAGQLLHKHLPRLANAVDVGIDPIAVVG